MRLKLAAIALGIVVVASAFGASAFTTATIDRSATIGVSSDNGGLIGLQAGSSPFVEDTTGELSIDVSGENGEGVNQNSTLQIGNASDPAFTVTNNFSSTQSLTLAYALSNTESSATTNVEFTVYNSTGANVATFSEGGSATLSNVDTGESHSVTIDIDTSGLDSTNDLSGNLTVTA